MLLLAAVIVATKEYGQELPEVLKEKLPAFIRSRHWGAAPLILIFLFGVTLFFDWATSQKASSPDVVTTGSLPKSEAGTPLGVAWATARIGTKPLIPDKPRGMVQIISFTVDAQNQSNEEIEIKDAYIVSGVDGSRVRLKISTPTDDIYPEEAAPIPPKATMHLIADFSNTRLVEGDFVMKWNTFSVVIICGDKQIRHRYDALWVTAQMDEYHSDYRPHVSKKVSGN